MDLKISQGEGYLLARIAGPLDHSARELFSQHLHPLVREHGTKLVLDLSKATSISSSGLGELVALVACANMHSSQVVLAACSPFVSVVLHRSKLATFFETAESVSEGVEMFLGQLQLA